MATIIIPVIFGASILMASADSIKKWEKFTNIAVDKEWTITFNRPIDTASILSNVYILDGTNKLTVTTTVSSNKLAITPRTDLEGDSSYMLVVTNNVRDTRGKAMNQKIEIPFTTKAATTIHKTFTSEYDMLWNMPTSDYEQFHLIGLKNDEQTGGYETRTGKEVFGIKIGASHDTVKVKYGTPIKYISKNHTNYTQNYVDKYDHETSGTYLIDNQYVTFFYDAHKNNTVRSVSWVSAQTEITKTGFFATPSTALRNNFESLMVELINQARVAEGLNAFIYMPQYNDIARKHSTSMAQNNYFGHEDLNGLRGGERMRLGGLSFSWWGENLAYGQYSAIYAHEALMNSLGHRENILRESFTHIFIGVDFNSNGQPYFSVNFYTL